MYRVDIFISGMLCLLSVVGGVLFWHRSDRLHFRTLGYLSAGYTLIGLLNLVWALQFFIPSGVFPPAMARVPVFCDALPIPLFACYVLELLEPKRRLAHRIVWPAYGILAGFAVLHLLYPSDSVLYVAAVVMSIALLCGIIRLYALLGRTKIFIRNTFAYSEGISPVWIMQSAMAFILLYIGWIQSVRSETSDIHLVIYEVASIVILAFVLSKALKQQPIYGNPVLSDIISALDSSDDPVYELSDEGNLDGGTVLSPHVLEMLGHRLARLEEEQPGFFANPELRMQDLCKAIQTNRTYLCRFLQSGYGERFYDYVNRMR